MKAVDLRVIGPLITKLHERNAIAAQPKFYHTLTHNCTNEITRRVEMMSEARFPLTWKTLLPGYFDEVLYEMNLIQKSGSFAETKSARLIDNMAVNPRGGSFSQELRGAAIVR